LKTMAQNILLIHGAFHTGECWYLLAPLLERAGFNVHTPTLRGQRGNPRHPLLVSLKSYTDDIIYAAEALPAPCILLGHSLAGFAISAAAERRPDLFSMLIYLTAAVPKLGRSTLRDATPSGPSQAPKMRLGLSVTFPQEHADDFMYHLCPSEVQTRARQLLSSQPLRPMLGTVKSTLPRLGAAKKHFFECLHDRVMPINEQRKKQSNQAFDSIQTLDADHSPFFSNPHALADKIKRVATVSENGVYRKRYTR
jgi:pimeloyl-ACP methyl ester carboxylesterase